MLVCKNDWCIFFCGFFEKNFLCFFLCFVNYYWYFWFDNVCFFFGNFWQGFFKKLYVVIVDICNNVQFWYQDISRVQMFIYVNFYYCLVDLFFCKIVECYSYCNFKKGRFNGLKKCFILFYKIYYCFFGYQFFVNFYLFMKIVVVRGSIKINFEFCCL